MGKDYKPFKNIKQMINQPASKHWFARQKATDGAKEIVAKKLAQTTSHGELAKAEKGEKPHTGEKLSSFAKSIGLAKGRYFCKRCEGQSKSVDWEGKCKSCTA